MNLPLAAYRAIQLPAYVMLPVLWVLALTLGRLPGRWARVLGDLGRQAGFYRRLGPPPDGERVWLQAVSVGEVAVATAIARRLLDLRPGVHLTISSSTSAGLAAARRLLGDQAQIIPYPLDLGLFTRRAAAAVAPHLYAAVETELWPDLLHRLGRRECALMLLNGRLSERSFRRYQRTRPLWASCLGTFDRLCMISHEDADRAIELGAPAERVVVGRNAKYDGMLERAEAGAPRDMADRLALGGRPLLVAGSARGAEMTALIEGLRRVLAARPEAVAALAPRHPENRATWARALEEKGLAWRAFSRLSPASPRPEDVRVVLVDTTGDLFDLYGLASLAFIGGSLVPLGGQNPMEPAAWGVPVIFGPHMEDFSDAAQALVDAGGAVIVDDIDSLARACLAWLDDPAAARAQGEAARRALAAWPFAADQAARLIVEQLQGMGDDR